LAKDKIRIQLDLNPHEVQALDRLRDSCSLHSRADAVRTSLAIFEWIQREVRDGRRILAVGEDDVVPLALPGVTILTLSESQE
jgi:hypothetical protein